MIAAVIFWTALFTFAALYPDYSHQTRAISELGAFGAPHALAWNLIGFIVPGVFLAVCGARIALAVDGRRMMLFWLLVISGLGFAGAGVFPAEVRNGDPVMQSPWTAGHVLMISTSGLSWVFAAFALVGRVQRSTQWSRSKGISLVLAVLALVGLAFNVSGPSMPLLADTPGLVQRIAFVVYFGWFLAAEQLFTTATPRSRRATA